jgi:hypothetical protein
VILISHRGNTNGRDISFENKPERILDVISQNINVEIDLRWYNNKFYLGHDEPQYEITEDFLFDNSLYLWVHCKERESFQQALKLKVVHCFWHDTDDYTMTNLGFVWAYPGKEPVGRDCIAVMPENCWTAQETLHKPFAGVCTDNCLEFKELLNRL